MFQLSNPQINRKILFTNLVELKEDLVDTFLQQEEPYIELYSVAQSWVLFERLIYKNVVKSHNQRPYLAACVKISVKLYELFGQGEAYRQKLATLNTDLQSFIERGKEGQGQESYVATIKKYERLTMIALHFEPRVPPTLVWPHIESIKVMCDKTLEEFLGTEHYNYYTDRIKAKMQQREARQDRQKQLYEAKKRG